MRSKPLPIIKYHPAIPGGLLMIERAMSIKPMHGPKKQNLMLCVSQPHDKWKMANIDRQFERCRCARANYWHVAKTNFLRLYNMAVQPSVYSIHLCMSYNELHVLQARRYWRCIGLIAMCMARHFS
jgi:hypothetical protein